MKGTANVYRIRIMGVCDGGMAMSLKAWCLTVLLLLNLATEANADPAPLKITSTAFKAGAMIPNKYGCRATPSGNGINPQIAWSKVPADTVSLAIIMVDLQYAECAFEDGGSEGPQFHWGLYRIPKKTKSIPKKFSSSKVSTTKNDNSQANYYGPCSCYGPHEYSFMVYALNTLIPKRAYGKASDLYNALTTGALKGNVVAQGSLNGYYRGY